MQQAGGENLFQMIKPQHSSENEEDKHFAVDLLMESNGIKERVSPLLYFLAMFFSVNLNSDTNIYFIQFVHSPPPSLNFEATKPYVTLVSGLKLFALILKDYEDFREKVKEIKEFPQWVSVPYLRLSNEQ